MRLGQLEGCSEDVRSLSPPFRVVVLVRRVLVGCGLAFLDLALRRCVAAPRVGWRGACATGDAAGPLRRETTIVENPFFIPFTPLLAPLSPHSHRGLFLFFSFRGGLFTVSC